MKWDRVNGSRNSLHANARSGWRWTWLMIASRERKERGPRRVLTRRAAAAIPGSSGCGLTFDCSRLPKANSQPELLERLRALRRNGGREKVAGNAGGNGTSRETGSKGSKSINEAAALGDYSAENSSVVFNFGCNLLQQTRKRTPFPDRAQKRIAFADLAARFTTGNVTPPPPGNLEKCSVSRIRTTACGRWRRLFSVSRKIAHIRTVITGAQPPLHQLPSLPFPFFHSFIIYIPFPDLWRNSLSNTKHETIHHEQDNTVSQNQLFTFSEDNIFDIASNWSVISYGLRNEDKLWL